MSLRGSSTGSPLPSFSLYIGWAWEWPYKQVQTNAWKPSHQSILIAGHTEQVLENHHKSGLMRNCSPCYWDKEAITSWKAEFSNFLHLPLFTSVHRSVLPVLPFLDTRAVTGHWADYWGQGRGKSNLPSIYRIRGEADFPTCYIGLQVLNNLSTRPIS